jgi:hypothetical protein
MMSFVSQTAVVTMDIHTVKRFNVFDTNAETEKSPQMPNMFEENWLRSKTLKPKNIHKGK